MTAVARVALICGSPRPGSANQAALGAAAAHLRGLGSVVVEFTSPLTGIPAFHPDQTDSAPDSVARLRDTVEAAGGVLIAAPEYAGGVSGSTKNALDWMIDSASMYRKRVGVMSAGTTGGHIAIEQLVRTLSWHDALVLATLSIDSPAARMVAGRYTDPDDEAAIHQWASTLTTALGQPWHTTIDLVMAMHHRSVQIARNRS